MDTPQFVLSIVSVVVDSVVSEVAICIVRHTRCRVVIVRSVVRVRERVTPELVQVVVHIVAVRLCPWSAALVTRHTREVVIDEVAGLVIRRIESVSDYKRTQSSVGIPIHRPRIRRRAYRELVAGQLPCRGRIAVDVFIGTRSDFDRRRPSRPVSNSIHEGATEGGGLQLTIPVYRVSDSSQSWDPQRGKLLVSEVRR